MASHCLQRVIESFIEQFFQMTDSFIQEQN